MPLANSPRLEKHGRHRQDRILLHRIKPTSIFAESPTKSSHHIRTLRVVTCGIRRSLARVSLHIRNPAARSVNHRLSTRKYCRRWRNPGVRIELPHGLPRMDATWYSFLSALSPVHRLPRGPCGEFSISATRTSYTNGSSSSVRCWQRLLPPASYCGLVLAST